jgi:L,D-peptidoglycan transpeptidase YkuD (ErfK/YbiS/YcfS/YnhG family)
MTKRGLKTIILITAAAIAVPACALVLGRILREPPLELYSRANISIVEARREGASIYAAELLASAESLLVIGETEFSRFNARWYLYPSMAPMKSVLSNAIFYANLAARMTAINRANERQIISRLLSDLAERIDERERSLNSDLNLMDCRKILLRAKTEFDIAGHLFKAGESRQTALSVEKAERSLEALDALYASYNRHGENSRNIWNSWVKETMSLSKKSGSAAVIIDKFAHRLYLLSGGKIIRSYPCDLGFNAGYDKKRRGDGATPEGKYHITKVMRASKYYKALRLNYPNNTDKVNFVANKKSGTIAGNAQIGGLIEIHGNGATGKDWTDGCIAVSNGDMDDLFKRVSAGTPVTIVRRSGLRQ